MTEDVPEFDKKPFVRKHLDTKSDIVPVRLNDFERQELSEVKDMLRIDADSTALKDCLAIAHNVLRTTFGKQLMQHLCSPRRVRPGPKKS